MVNQTTSEGDAHFARMQNANVKFEIRASRVGQALLPVELSRKKEQ